jgi:hypothetical protein
MTTEDEITKQIAIRLPVPLLTRLEEHAERMKRDAPGRLTVTRADAIRALLADALDAVDKTNPSKP